MIIWLLIGLIFVCFAVLPLLFRGAPYLPTHTKSINLILDKLQLRKGSTVVDLGSGDGAFLQQAASRGLVAIGYEINPLLCLIAWLRCRRYGQSVKIVWRDFWTQPLPPATQVVFVFLASAHMQRLAKKVQAHVNKNGKQIILVSYGFELFGHQTARRVSGAYIYKLKPSFTNQP